MSAPLLLVGELFVDFTLTSAGSENKLRLGGIAHAARGLWAIGAPFAVAAICPRYLKESAREYLERFGCAEFIYLGEVVGAPNIMVIGDPTEVGDQGYENLLREDKSVSLSDAHDELSRYNEALIFPGAFNLNEVRHMLLPTVRAHFDIAYDIRNADDLLPWRSSIETILISTSSELFRKLNSGGIKSLVEGLRPLLAKTIVLKENRGGARIVNAETNKIERIPAILGTTENSVGVGDVFSASFVTLAGEGNFEAGLKATRVSSAYAQTTFPDIFKAYVDRSLKLTVEQMQLLGGTSLPWENRPNYPIYLAAPDFSYVNRDAIEAVLRSLQYHNFTVRRPVQENGELPKNANASKLVETFYKDRELLDACSLLFAVPTDRDPGTLVEIGLAIEKKMPVVIYDPRGECRNAMVVGGATCYSTSLDDCLNSIFTALSEKDFPP